MTLPIEDRVLTINQYQAYLRSHGYFGEELAEEVGESLRVTNSRTLRVRGKFVGLHTRTDGTAGSTSAKAIVKLATFATVQRLEIDLTTILGQTLLRKLALTIPLRELEIEIWDSPVNTDPCKAGQDQCLSVRQGRRWIPDPPVNDLIPEVDASMLLIQAGPERDAQLVAAQHALTVGWYVKLARNIGTRFTPEWGIGYDLPPAQVAEREYEVPQIITNVLVTETSNVEATSDAPTKEFHYQTPPRASTRLSSEG